MSMDKDTQAFVREKVQLLFEWMRTKPSHKPMFYDAQFHISTFAYCHEMVQGSFLVIDKRTETQYTVLMSYDEEYGEFPASIFERV